MIAWIKSLFKTECTTLPNVSCTIPIPKVKPPKGMNISEPVSTLAELWKTDKKRFQFTYEHPNIYKMYTGGNLINRDTICIITVVDKYTEEYFKFWLELSPIVIKDIWPVYRQKKFGHRVYPVLGYNLYSQPSWMTCDEAKYLCDLVTPYFKERVERYSKLIDYREDRKVEAGKRQTERAKQEERQRLINLYTKDS